MTSLVSPVLAFPGQPNRLWRLSVPGSGRAVDFAAPVIEIDGQPVTLMGPLTPIAEPTFLPHGPAEHIFAAPVEGQPGLTLRLIARVAEGSPVLRFRYELHSDCPRSLTKSTGADNLSYLSTSFTDWPRVTEVQLSQFNQMVHSFCLQENAVTEGEFANALPLMGPILTAENDSHTLLLAYEHGSQVPDAFVQFALSPERVVTLQAVKGNYCAGQLVGPDSPFRTLWMQTALLPGTQDDMAAAYRAFVLRHMSANPESRKPYLFYNTWNFQERSKHWHGQAYLTPMTQQHILAEIDAAHRMGVEVFVLDTGWYEKTGDWRVNLSRFPDGLQSVKARLDGYGMKLGLWFDPLAAAVTSDMYARHTDCRITRGGKSADPCSVWETEASVRLCLVSRYADAFAQELIRLVQDVGVTYFKWDAIGQYGCDDPGHHHGTADSTQEERADSYAFQLARAMAGIVDTLCAACPEAIVDFDVTEGERAMGLQFLAAGKYFLINNGPYSMNYDRPAPADGNVNLFFYPGPARGWVCRTPLTYDRWIPSVLLLTHYLPDDVYTKYGWNAPEQVTEDANQWIALASLVLGQNGVWGDLLGVTTEGQARFGEAVSAYKELRDAITLATLVRTGVVGGSPEVYEKIDAQSGRGVVSIFASAAGTYRYVTRVRVAEGIWHNAGASVAVDAQGHAIIYATFTAPSARLILFGTGTR